MTNYNERLEEVVRNAYSGEISWIYDQLDGTSFIGESLERVEKDIIDTKQAITSLIKELVAEAKPMVASKEAIQTYLQNGMTQKAAEYHGRNHAIEQFEYNLLKELEEKI